MEQRFFNFGSTCDVGTSPYRFALDTVYFTTADGATIGHHETLGLCRATVFENLNDFGDYVAPFFDEHEISNLQTQSHNFILIMKRGATNGRTCQLDWFQICDRCQGS